MDLAFVIALFLLLGSLSMPIWAVGTTEPPIMLAKSWQTSLDPTGFLVSEKLDGVRAYWDGKHLYSRGGLVINAPAWFTGQLPDTPLDGELWAGYGSFARISGLVRKIDLPNDEDWQGVKFMVFDLPHSPAMFEDRYWVLKTLVAELRSDVVDVVRQRSVDGNAALDAMLADVVGRGGEGLILKQRRSVYQASRSNDMLKYKMADDAEAVVIGHLPGKGKYQGMVGALRVALADGREISLGSGLSDALRRDPPAKGTLVTYSYNGYTSTGLPRFARFLRVRDVE